MKWQSFLPQTIYILAVGYFIFLTYNAVMTNYRTNQKIALLRSEIDLAQAERDYLGDLNVYYATDTYRELEARRKLGYKKTDEKVIRMIVDENRLNALESREAVSAPTAASVGATESDAELSNPRKWLEFVLGT